MGAGVSVINSNIFKTFQERRSLQALGGDSLSMKDCADIFFQMNKLTLKLTSKRFKCFPIWSEKYVETFPFM